MTLALRRLHRFESGGALVELAVSLPLLALILVGTADFARVFYTSIELNNAARAGAQFGAQGLAESGNIALMQSSATSAAPNLTGVTAAASRSCDCADNSGVFSGPVSCTAPINTICPGALHRVMSVTVTASTTFSTISALLGVPCRLAVGGCGLARSATLRVSE